MKPKKGTVFIRFHLAQGEHFKHWQIKDADGQCTYYNPQEVSIYMSNAKLCNYRRVAESIFNGASKTVCAWIAVSVKDYAIIGRDDKAFPVGTNLTKATPIVFNPRVNPHWVRNGENADGMIIPQLLTCGTAVNEIEVAIA